MAIHGCQAATVRSVSVPCGGRCLDRVTQSQGNAAAGSGRPGSRATSAWTGMCVDQLGSSVRLTHSVFLFALIWCSSCCVSFSSFRVEICLAESVQALLSFMMYCRVMLSTYSCFHYVKYFLKDLKLVTYVHHLNIFLNPESVKSSFELNSKQCSCSHVGSELWPNEANNWNLN